MEESIGIWEVQVFAWSEGTLNECNPPPGRSPKNCKAFLRVLHLKLLQPRNEVLQATRGIRILETINIVALYQKYCPLPLFVRDNLENGGIRRERV